MSNENQVAVVEAPEVARVYWTMERFAEVWNASSSVEEVAEKTGLKLNSIKTKVVSTNKLLVEAGVSPLKKFASNSKRGRAKRDVAAIAAAAARGLEASAG